MLDSAQLACNILRAEKDLIEQRLAAAKLELEYYRRLKEIVGQKLMDAQLTIRHSEKSSLLDLRDRRPQYFGGVSNTSCALITTYPAHLIAIDSAYGFVNQGIKLGVHLD